MLKNNAILFPGQGSQHVGMGKDLYDTFSEAKETFQEVDEILEYSLSKLMFSGDEEQLRSTQNAQPAIMAVSIATLVVMEKQFGFDVTSQIVAAGHSLGEYSALCATKALTLADTTRLLKTRGTAMQNALPEGKGGMVAILGLNYDAIASVVEEVNKNHGFCQIANDNGAGQFVISGEIEALNAAIKVAKDYKARRALMLPVSAPFHSKLMEPAKAIMENALSEVTISKPIIPVIANVTAKATQSPKEIRKLLADQVTESVRWRETMENMPSISCFIEIGPGSVLKNISKRMYADKLAISMGSPKDIEEGIKIMEAK